MLISWMSHDAYCSFISQGITSLPLHLSHEVNLLEL